MIKTPSSTVIGGAGIWTPGATIIGASSKNLTQLIKSIFATGEQGFAYDPNDLTTLFQDAAGTIPVTAAGQPVGLMIDKSGRNNHAFQTVSASRPVLQRNATTGAYYLAFDGADDFLVTNNIDFTMTDKVSLFVGVLKLRDTDTSSVVELSSNPNNVSGSVALASLSTQNYQITSRGSISSFRRSSVNSAPFSCVIATKSAISADVNNMRVNGLDQGTTSTDQGTGNYGNYQMYIGRRGGLSLPFSGHLYGLIGVGRLTTDGETLAVERELAKQTGVVLNV